MIERIETLSKTKTGRITSLVLSMIVLLFMGIRALYVRINATGWSDFPATTLDYFAVIGSVMLFLLAAGAIYGIVKNLRVDNNENTARSEL